MILVNQIENMKEETKYSLPEKYDVLKHLERKMTLTKLLFFNKKISPSCYFFPKFSGIKLRKPLQRFTKKYIFL